MDEIDLKDQGKQRELLPKIKDIIGILSQAAKEAAELEYTFNRATMSSLFRKMMDVEASSKQFRGEISKIRAERRKKA